jgi:20S proteasome alpha/beta subunit
MLSGNNGTIKVLKKTFFVGRVFRMVEFVSFCGSAVALKYNKGVVLAADKQGLL